MRVAPLLVVVAGCTAAADPAPPPRGAEGPVVLELFTSQGCSSCPPADRWLAALAPGDAVAGRAVIPLAFHVDYWDDLGWRDPFSSAAWSERQAWYAERLPSGRVYTPALVIAGVTHAVGSRTGDVTRAIANAPATADLDATLTRDGTRLRVAARHAFAAVIEERHDTAIEAGENAGEHAHDAHIVRALVPVDGEAVIDVAPSWGDVRVVVFAQEPGGAITAARVL